MQLDVIQLSKIWKNWLVLFTFTGLCACSPSADNFDAAPLGERTSLEKLAHSYRSLAEDIPGNPLNMKPAARKRFVEQVFSQSGYSYHKTLLALSRLPRAEQTQLHRDMQELLFLPHYRTELESMLDVYKEEEIKAIRAMQP